MILGRETELAAIDRFLDGNGASAVLVLAGEAGAGKTTLWEEGLAAARERGRRILSARPSGAETRLSFVTLVDLLDGVDSEVLDALPAPQRRALDVALLADEPDGAPPELRAVAVALLGVLRTLAAQQPLLAAVDDVQWLDADSRGALSFVARRAGDRVLFLLAQRTGPDAGSALALPAPDRVEVGALDDAAIFGLLEQRLGLTVPRRLMGDVMEVSGGNPLFALEVGRSLADRGIPWIGERLAVPAAVDELLGARMAALPFAVQAIVLAVALSPLRRAELGRVAEPYAVEAAIKNGAVVVDGERVRLAHPLLGRVALGRTSDAEQRAMHARLAEALDDETRRAHHLAQAVEEPDEALAETVARAAERAVSRGAAQDAAELSEHALRLTPGDSPERPGRVLALAEHLLRAGRNRRLNEVLTAELPRLPPGGTRVRAYLLLNEGAEGSEIASYEEHMQQALVEAAGDPVLAAPALADKANTMLLASVERVQEAEQLTVSALEAAPAAGPDVERQVLHALAWARSLRGKPIDDVTRRFAAVGGTPPHAYRSVDRVVGVRHGWRGDVRAARRLLSAMLGEAEESGDTWSYVAMRLHLCEVEVRAGEWEAVQALLDGWEQFSDENVVAPVRERMGALLAAGRGEPAEAERLAGEALAASEQSGVVWDRLEAWRALGIAALAARDPESAAEWLGRVWEHTCREGVDEPGAFPVAADLVEALVEAGESEEARSVADRLAALADEQDHPWGLLAARRCRALLAAAEDEDVAGELSAVAAEYVELGLRADAARTLLALGRVERRRRRWGAAREALTGAAEAFDAQAAPGWAALARAELQRVGGRKPRSDPGELTPSERRVAELAAAGRSNKEIAQTLVVSINTVEGHLTRAYAKLGVRSRAELGGRLAQG